MARPTAYDLAVCRQVLALTEGQCPVSPSEVRLYRERGIVEVVGNKRGGRGKAATYARDTARIIAAVEAAKRDPGYRNKFPRAVLIAWARRTPIRDAGWRWAFGKHFDHERLMAIRQLGALEANEVEPSLPVSIDASRALAEAQLGQRPRPDALAVLERDTGRLVHQAAWSAASDLLPTLASDGKALGLVEQRADGSVAVLSLGKRVWETMAFHDLERIARTASREEMEAARDRVRPMMTRAGFHVSDLVVAAETPRLVMWFRSTVGQRWWMRANR